MATEILLDIKDLMKDLICVLIDSLLTFSMKTWGYARRINTVRPRIRGIILQVKITVEIEGAWLGGEVPSFIVPNNILRLLEKAVGFSNSARPFFWHQVSPKDCDSFEIFRDPMTVL